MAAPPPDGDLPQLSGGDRQLSRELANRVLDVGEQIEVQVSERSCSTNEIVINWVDEAESTTALYWPALTWPRQRLPTRTRGTTNDTTQTDSAILVSGDPTKTFTFERDVLEYELTAMCVTMTVQMSRQ